MAGDWCKNNKSFLTTLEQEYKRQLLLLFAKKKYFLNLKSSLPLSVVISVFLTKKTFFVSLKKQRKKTESNYPRKIKNQ